MLKRSAGFALPFLLMALSILVVLAGGVASLALASLNVTRLDKGSEQAVYAAEAGLAAAAEEYGRTGSLPQPYEGPLPTGQGSYAVTLYENAAATPKDLKEGITLPPNTIYLLSSGMGREGSRRQAAGLFRLEAGIFQAGALADNLVAENSTFDAYASDREPDGYTGGSPHPDSLVTDAGILASNRSTGLPFQFTNSRVDGGVYVGPGGDPKSQIKKTGSTISKEGALREPIEVAPIEVPATDQGEGDPAAPAAEKKNEPSPTPFSFNGTSVSPPSRPGDPVVIRKYCLTMKMWDDGRFWAQETGSGSTVSGNFNDQTVDSSSGSFNVSFAPFNVNGVYHQVIVDPANQRVGFEPNEIRAPHGAATYTAAPSWLCNMVSASSDPSVTNPDELEAGRYENVTIDAVSTALQDGGVYVIENLFVRAAGQLELAADAKDVTLYVTGSLTVDGQDAILNATRRAPNLKVYYTGTEPVKVSGGSQAYFTLMAPNADVELNGRGSAYFGALVGRSVTVRDASFHYDLATSGVGAGSAGAPLTVLARYRP